MSNAQLELHDIDIVRGARTLISGLTLTLNTPQVLWIEGGNGIGKTSLLRSCAGLSRADAGHIFWRRGDAPVPATEVIGYLPANPTMKPTFTLAEDATLWNATPHLNTVGLSDHTQTRTERLSTGQGKRLALAKLLATDKPIWILDEPLAGLDQQGRDLIARLLQTHVAHGGLALVASHAPLHLADTPQQRLTLEAS